MNAFSAPMIRILCHPSSCSSPKGMPCSLRNRMRCSRGIRRSWLPGMRYPFSRPESNHLLTVRGATLQILATWPVVNTFLMADTPVCVCQVLTAARTDAGTSTQGTRLLGQGSECRGQKTEVREQITGMSRAYSCLFADLCLLFSVSSCSAPACPRRVGADAVPSSRFAVPIPPHDSLQVVGQSVCTSLISFSTK